MPASGGRESALPPAAVETMARLPLSGRRRLLAPAAAFASLFADLATQGAWFVAEQHVAVAECSGLGRLQRQHPLHACEERTAFAQRYGHQHQLIFVAQVRFP